MTLKKRKAHLASCSRKSLIRSDLALITTLRVVCRAVGVQAVTAAMMIMRRRTYFLRRVALASRNKLLRKDAPASYKVCFNVGWKLCDVHSCYDGIWRHGLEDTRLGDRLGH